MKNFIVLEGLSGSGKTTIGKLLAERMGADFYKTPPAVFRSIRDEVDRTAGTMSRFFFYLSGTLLSSQEISRILENRDVICDRYIYTTICYHLAIGLDFEIPAALFQQIVMPNHFFLVTCREETRIKRLSARGMTANDIAERKEGIEARFIAEYRKFKPVEIDNSGNSPEYAVEQIMGIVGRG